jgi:BlaI family penicillinase repressor
MARTPSEFLTDREAQIMDILWSQGEATAETVRQLLADEPHDSTVRTLLRVLKEKRYVRVIGRQPAKYRPRISREQAQSKAARSLLSRLFGGAADTLVLRLLEDKEISHEQIDQLRKKFQARERKGDQT